MCLLLHRPEGIEIPAQLIAQAGYDNPHGWGIMLADGRRIRTWRGMKMGAIDKAIRAVGSAECVIHWRMATHGTTDLANCHPFEFKAGGMGFGLAHNGIFANIKIAVPNRSDTWHYAQKMAKILSANPTLFERGDWLAHRAAKAGPFNKVAILRSDGALAILNRNHGIEWEGLWMSNGYSLPTRRSVGLWARSADSDCETWQDTAKLGWDDGFDDLEMLASLPTADLAEWCERDPDWIAEVIQNHFQSDRKWR